ncbi:MAG: hypothetical protein LBC75_10220 [Fibromonadaceae bacterium]|jgi:TolB-like protein|nr:hypothetical protein [Fibromonadaceae bacterium]
MNKLLFTLLLLALAAYAQQERVAIIQTMDNNDSIGFNDLAYLTDKLRETAVNVLPKEQYGVMTTESIVAFLGSQERAAKICNESSCLAELGRMVSADFVAQGRIGRFGKDLTIKVELYNVKSGNLIGSFTGDSKDIYGLRDIITEKATDLFKKMLNTSNVKKNAPPLVVAQPPDTHINEKPLQYLQFLIKDGIKKNKEEIQKKSFYLSLEDKEVFYKKNKEKIPVSLVLASTNVFLFGLGSYIQRNIIWGLAQSVLGIGGIVVVSNTSHGSSYQELGTYMLGSSMVIGLVAPFVYQYKYNKALREALNFDDSISFFIDPLIVPKDGTPAVGLAFNVRY